MSRNPPRINIDPAILQALPDAVEKFNPASKVAGMTIQGMEQLEEKIIDAVKEALEKEIEGQVFTEEVAIPTTDGTERNDNQATPPAVSQEEETQNQISEDNTPTRENDDTPKKAPDTKDDASLNDENDNDEGEEVTQVPGIPQGEKNQNSPISPQKALDQFGEGEAPQNPGSNEQEGLTPKDDQSNTNQSDSSSPDLSPQQQSVDDSHPAPDQEEEAATDSSSPNEPEETEPEEEETEEKEKAKDKNNTTNQPREEQNPEQKADSVTNDTDEVQPGGDDESNQKKRPWESESEPWKDSKKTKNGNDPYNQFDEDENPGDQQGAQGQSQNEAGEGEGGSQNGERPGQPGQTQQNAEKEEQEKAEIEEDKEKNETRKEQINQEINKRQRKIERELLPKIKKLDKEIGALKKKTLWLGTKISVEFVIVAALFIVAAICAITIVGVPLAVSIAGFAGKIMLDMGENSAALAKAVIDIREKQKLRKETAGPLEKEQKTIKKLAVERNSFRSRFQKAKKNNQ